MQLGGLWQQNAAAHPKNIYFGSHRDTFAQRLPKKTSFPWIPTRQVGYPHGPSIIHMGSQSLLPTVALKNEFSQDTHLPCRVSKWSSISPIWLHPCAWPQSLSTKPKNTYSWSHRDTFAQGRVPTWSLYNTHGVAPLCLALFLGYTGVIPLLNQKRVFPGYQPTLQGTLIAPLQHTWGGTPMLAPVSGNEALPHAPKTLILGPIGTLSPKVSLQGVFPGNPPGGSNTHMVRL